MTVTTGAAWHSVRAHRALALLLCAGLPVEIAAAANLVLRVGSVDSTGGGVVGIGWAFAAMSLAFAAAVIPAGILVDRTPARLTFAVALTARAFPMLIGGVLAASGTLSPTAVVALATADGLSMALLRPSWQHFQACLVPAGAARDAAILDDWLARAGALFGALVGGAAVALGHTGSMLLACAAGFLPLLAALACGLGKQLREPISISTKPGSLLDAVKAVRNTPRLAHATRTDVILALALPVGMLTPAITVATSAVHYLWLIALAGGFGALVGTTWVTVVWNRMCPARLLRRAAALLVAVLAVQALFVAGGTPKPAWLAALFVTVTLAEGAMTAMFAVTGSLLQADAPEGTRGVVTGLAQSAKHLAAFLSAAVTSIVMAWAGPGISLGLIAFVLAAGAFRLRGFIGLAALRT